MDLIKGPVGRVLALVVWLAIFSLIVGAINEWFLQTVDAGTMQGQRFDRVVAKDPDDKSGDERWALISGVADAFTGSATSVPSMTTTYKVEDDGSGNCKVGETTGTEFTAQTWYTPMGNEVQSDALSAAGDVLIKGCEWANASQVLLAGGLGGLVKIILQAAGLAPPIALLFAVGSFGMSFMKNVGSHPVLAAIGMVIMLILVAYLLSTYIPFLDSAYAAIDGNRFIMFDEGLGAISGIVGSFFGIVTVASMMTIAWQIVKSLRGGGDVIASADKM